MFSTDLFLQNETESMKNCKVMHPSKKTNQL